MNDETLSITESISEGTCNLTAKGRIDSNSAALLQEKLENALKTDKKNIILNMYEIKYLSSIGIRVILKIYKQAKETGITFNISHPSEFVKNVLGMVALKEMLVT
ncbi:MAG: STAS domain-containing protein [Treponema sp.]|jgi:anti-sigma B factor antagonist|nr:STAS domain-containing protein [Treponema sp.]